MNMSHSNRFLTNSLRILCVASALAATSAWAAFTTWDLNPDNLNESVGSASRDYTVDGYTITARGYDNQNGGVGSEHILYYKNSGDDRGLGLVDTLHNELQVGPDGTPLHFIQLDLTSILAAGFMNGRISVGSVEPGEAFNLYGSNALGILGTLLNGTPYGSDTNNGFVDVPDFGTYQFLSIVSAADDILPVAFQAELVPVPEVASLVPAALLVIGATLFEARRRRRAAR